VRDLIWDDGRLEGGTGSVEVNTRWILFDLVLELSMFLLLFVRKASYLLSLFLAEFLFFQQQRSETARFFFDCHHI
jgi:hypothetical protein